MTLRIFGKDKNIFDNSDLDHISYKDIVSNMDQLLPKETIVKEETTYR